MRGITRRSGRNVLGGSFVFTFASACFCKNLMDWCFGSRVADRMVVAESTAAWLCSQQTCLSRTRRWLSTFAGEISYPWPSFFDPIS